ncbi:hypothetical protein NAPIS_ORF01210 [Vairimorpha apis BRL 01]|uniref:Uncharacterized protein n=1 Tax=Vairimorpha apis BRL 01 TaxID=1037528 RepID=T0L9Q0_9MICR|nr:hypothetical protein NAPIS_ORF01210 [Vairimorpha apis BRL 01]
MLITYILLCRNREAQNIYTNITNDKYSHNIIIYDENDNNRQDFNLQYDSISLDVIPEEDEELLNENYTNEQISMNSDSLFNDNISLDDNISLNETSIQIENPLIQNIKTTNIFYRFTKLILQFLIVLGMIFLVMFCLSLDFTYLYFMIGLFVMSIIIYIINEYYK